RFAICRDDYFLAADGLAETADQLSFELNPSPAQTETSCRKRDGRPLCPWALPSRRLALPPSQSPIHLYSSKSLSTGIRPCPIRLRLEATQAPRRQITH